MENLNYALKKEDQLATLFHGKKCVPFYSPGSRGPADLVIKCPGRPMAVQMKSTRKYIPDADTALAHGLKELSLTEERKLVRKARSSKARPVLSVTSGNYVWMWEISRRGYKLIHDGRLPQRRLCR